MRCLRLLWSHPLERGGVRIEFTKALARWSEIRRAGWFIHENAPGVKAVLSDFPVAASINHPFAQYRA